jgi:hypothetical protein
MRPSHPPKYQLTFLLDLFSSDYQLSSMSEYNEQRYDTFLQFTEMSLTSYLLALAHDVSSDFVRKSVFYLITELSLPGRKAQFT